MRVSLGALQILLISILGGCSVYPLPQDTAETTTADIVANFRCQARRAVRHATAEKVADLGTKVVFRGYTGIELAELLRSNGNIPGKKQVTLEELKDSKLRASLAYYASTLVTYEFTLQMTEGNRQGGGIEFLRRFNRRLDTIGIGLAENRTRDVKRVFVLHDSFFNLALKIDPTYCARKPSVDLIFPSRGRLPVEDLVNTYIYLNEWGTLDSASTPNLEGTKKGPATRQMADTITFTTSLAATNNPTVSYNPIGTGFLTSGLSFINENSRTDLHKVIVTLTTTDVPDGKGDFKSIPRDELRETGDQAIMSVRGKNFQDDVNTIARTFSQDGLPGL
ncbi:hypothetical protein [uncultured Methylobacterium sp.]|uniref:hypothetical protein n=1 Tax=uncultured Methylobacterium sp. TaxID=157278 RepID=UPI00260E38CB|nr:hypothetical protein [uncultured Methylobacterium sp.]